MNIHNEIRFIKDIIGSKTEFNLKHRDCLIMVSLQAATYTMLTHHADDISDTYIILINYQFFFVLATNWLYFIHIQVVTAYKTID